MDARDEAMRLHYIKKASMAKKLKRLAFIRRVISGCVRCPVCKKSLKVLKKKNRVSRAGYCPSCFVVLNFEGQKTNLQALLSKSDQYEINIGKEIQLEFKLDGVF